MWKCLTARRLPAITSPRLIIQPSYPLLLTRTKRHEAYGAELDQEALSEARTWFRTLNPSTLPKGRTTYARSSGPGGQHVNKTETKAVTAFPVQDLLAALPRSLHSAVRASKYYTAGTDSLTFQAQEHRSRSANADENQAKLLEEITRIYHAKTPAETSDEKRKKHQQIEKRFHESRLHQKKMTSAKKQSRRGPPE